MRFPDDFWHRISRHGTVELDAFAQRNSYHFQIDMGFWPNCKGRSESVRYTKIHMSRKL